MKITLEDLKASYRNMSDEELLDLNPGELTEMARKAYEGEIERRGLSAEAEEEQAGAPAINERLVEVRNCDSADEAWAIVSALQGAGIPARATEGAGLGHYPVAVPASRADEARTFLNAEAPDAIIITARYENGVFKPLDDIDLPEGTVVEIHVPSDAFGSEES